MTPRQPIVISTFGDLAAHGMTLTLYCAPCRRQVEVDLTAFPPEMTYLRRRFRCRCGEPGRAIVSTIRPMADGWAGRIVERPPVPKAVLWPPLP